MDDARFDRLTKGLAKGRTRRSFFKTFGGAALGGSALIAAESRASAAANKVGVCHYTGSASNPVVYIEVAEPAVAAHLAHGDNVVDLSSDTANCGSCDFACPASTDPCLVASCVDGACSFAPADDGTSCSTGNACTTGDFCQGGVCVGGDAVVCDSGSPCIIDSCDPSVGCVQEMKIQGSSCDDGNPCNGNEVCDGAGNCEAGTPVVCHPLDQCHGVGVCDSETGACSNPPLNGTPCNDQNSCTSNDTCHQGVCSGTLPNFNNDPYNCGGCGQSCPGWTGYPSATCGGYGTCCAYTSAGPACCPIGYSRPSVCPYTCGTYQCNCYTYDCGPFGSDTCTACDTCYRTCYAPCCV